MFLGDEDNIGSGDFGLLNASCIYPSIYPLSLSLPRSLSLSKRKTKLLSRHFILICEVHDVFTRNVVIKLLSAVLKKPTAKRSSLAITLRQDLFCCSASCYCLFWFKRCVELICEQKSALFKQCKSITIHLILTWN